MWSPREETRVTRELRTIHTGSTSVHVEFTLQSQNWYFVRPLALIEPDPDLSHAMREALELAGFRTESFRRGLDALLPLKTRAFALAVVDLDLTDTDPLAVCREASRIVPVLAVAPVCSGEPCVKALDSGADGCVSRAVTGRELVARVRNILQRLSPESLVDVGGLEFSVTEMRVRSGEQLHELTRGESELLALLLRYSPRPLSAAEIAELLGTKRGTIESRIKSLRRKLGSSRLVTRGSLGYALDEDGTATQQRPS